MKKWMVLLCFFLLVIKGGAQSQEAEQLLLNWEKLTQFKKILKNMYDGYRVLHKGYTTIKDISEGSFSLHKTFLDALLEVSPAVRNYKKVRDILSLQVRLVKDCKAALRQFGSSGHFTPSEIGHLEKVYHNLLRQSVASIEELAMIITAGRLRMNDEERLALIDKIYTDVQEQVSFLTEFNSSTVLLYLQRGSEKADVELSRKLRGF